MSANNEKLTKAEEIERLIQEIKALSSADREMVFKHLRNTYIVIINDWLGSNQEQPCAIVLYSRHKWESIDILASVRNNAASIGHPAILIAIERWEQAVLTQYPLSRDRKQRAGTASDKAARGDFKNIAKQHLKNIGDALLKAADDRKRRNSNLSIFKTLIQRIDEADVSYLKMAWKMLSQKEIHYKSYGIDEDGREHKKERSYEQKIRKLKTSLVNRFAEYGFGEESFTPSMLDAYDSFPPESKREALKTKEDFLKTISSCFGPIFDFLSSDQCKPFIDKRPTWAALRNSYITWRTGLDNNTVRNYGSRSRRYAEKPVKLDFSFLISDVEGNNHYTREVTDSFLLPITPCSLTTCPCRDREQQD